MPITVTVNFTFRPSETTYLRIVVGRKALNTTVRRLPKLGVWELEAVVPQSEDEQPQTAVVPITAQALTETNGALDAVTVGSYTYWLCMLILLLFYYAAMLTILQLTIRQFILPSLGVPFNMGSSSATVNSS